MKSAYIIKESKEIKAYYEKNKKMPLTCNMNGTIYSVYATSYLMATLINSNVVVKDYAVLNVTRYNTATYADTIPGEKVELSDYTQMVKNFLNYCKANKRVPAYITTTKSKTKVSYELFVFCLSKIISFYSQNNYLPKYCIMNKNDLKKVTPSTDNCKNPYKSLPYNSNTGCDGMGQNTNYYCGVCALQKVLYKFGIHITQKELAKLAGTTSAGTSHQGIKTAVAYVAKKYNKKLTVKEYNFNELGWEKTAKLFCKKNVDIIWHLLYRGQYGHYEKVKQIDLINNTLEVVNSLGNKCSNGCFCGYIEKRDFSTQRKYMSGISQPSLIVITEG